MPRNLIRAGALLVGFCVASGAAPAVSNAGTSAAIPERRHHLLLELKPRGIALGYGRTLSGRVTVGALAGIGSDCYGALLSSGHFAETPWACRHIEETVREVVTLEIGVRALAVPCLFAEAGVRAALGIHASNNSAMTTFGGAFVGFAVGTRHLTIGTRLAAGSLSEFTHEAAPALIWFPAHLRLTAP